MNKPTYLRVRQSIRDNGLRYTAQHAIDADDTDAMFVCDAVANLIKETDWLALRVVFARRNPGGIAFKLTTSQLQHRDDVWVEQIH